MPRWIEGRCRVLPRAKPSGMTHRLAHLHETVLHASQGAEARLALGQAYAGLGAAVALDALFILWCAVRGALHGGDPAGRFGPSPRGQAGD
jgi:hypothetical protein